MIQLQYRINNTFTHTQQVRPYMSIYFSYFDPSINKFQFANSVPLIFYACVNFNTVSVICCIMSIKIFPYFPVCSLYLFWTSGITRLIQSHEGQEVTLKPF